MTFSPVEGERLLERLRTAGCVFAEDEAAVLMDAATTPDELESMVRRRVGGLPLEQVVGWAAFHGLRIVVEAGVFVPRRRTELLVDEAVALAPARALVVDLCCGSGAVGAAVAAARPDIALHAADIDPAAVRCARRNIAIDAGDVHEGDLFDALPDDLRGRVDVVVACAPYVPREAIGLMPPEARLHEPLAALDGGLDGLDIVRRMADGCGDWLAPGGRLIVEASEDQAAEVVGHFARRDLRGRIVSSQQLGATVVVGTAVRS